MRKFITDILAKANLGVEQNAYVLGTVGIGTASPSYKLHVEGTIYSPVYTSGNITINAGDFLFSADGGGDGFQMDYYNGQMYLGNNAGTSWHMVMQDNGNIGIGTTSPADKLQVIASTYNGITITTPDVATFKMRSSSGATTSWGFATTNLAASDFGIYESNSVAGDPINAGTARLYFKTGGNVGIGTTSPAAKLHIAGGDVWINTVSTMQGMQFGYSGPSHGSYRAAVMGGPELYGGTDSGMLTFHTQNGYVVSATPPERMRITSSGNVGIGTTSPSTRLDLAGGILSMGALNSGTEIRLRTGFANNSSGGVGITPIDHNGGNADGLGLYGSDGMSMWTSQTERMRITSGGVVGIATSSPYTGLSTRLYVGYDQNSSVAVRDEFISVGAAGGSTNTAGINFLIYNAGYGAKIYTDDNLVRGLAFDVLQNGTFYNAMSITRTSSPNVGIGTTSPAYKLDVDGGGAIVSARFYNSSNPATVIYVGDSGNTDYSDIILQSNSGTGEIFKAGTGYTSYGGALALNIFNSNGAIAFHPNSTANAMFIATSGNVGIGTTSPANKLVVTSDASPTSENSYSIAAASASDPAYKTVIGYSYANDVGLIAAVRTAIGWRNISMPQGNLGIGTLSPLSRIQSQIESSGSALMLVNANGGGGAYVDLDFNTYTPYQSGYANPGATIRVVDNGAYSGNITFRTKGASIGAAQSERMRIEASTGNVGINNTSPAYKLDVIGNIRSYSGFTSNGYHADTFIQNILPSSNNGAATGDVQLRMWCSEPGVTWDWAGFGYNVINDGASPYGFGRLNSGFGQAYMRFSPSGAMYFYNTTTGNVRTNTMSFSDIGNVGIGTTSTVVNSLLNVAGGINTTTGIIGYETSDAFTLNGKTQPYYGFNLNPTGSSPIGISGYYGVALATQGSERMRILQNGNVGIGTASPANKLEVYTSATAENVFSVNNGTQRLQLGVNNSEGSFVFEQNSYALRFGTANTERMRITADGNVLIGATADVASSRRELVMRGANGSVISLGNNTTADRFQIVSDSGENALLVNKANTPMILYTNNTERIRITADGNVGIGTTSPSYKLDVNGDGRFSGRLTMSTGGYVVTNNDIVWGNISGNYIGQYYNGTDLHFYNGTGGANFFSITRSTGAATFSSTLTAGGIIQAGGYFYNSFSTSGFYNAYFQNTSSTGYGLYSQGGSTGKNALTIKSYGGTDFLTIDGGTGAATFSSSVSATTVGAGSGTNQAYLGAGFLGFYNAASSPKYIQLTDDASTINAIAFSKSGSSSTTWFPSGNVGIGTSSPGFKLTVAGDSGNWATKFSSGTASAYFALSEGYGASIDAGTSATSSTYLLQLVSNNTTKVFVRGDGQMGIGTGAPSLESGGIGLDINNDSYTQLRVRSSSTSAGIEFKPGTGNRWEIQASTTNQFFVYDRTNNLYRFLNLYHYKKLNQKLKIQFYNFV